ncbi:MAG: protein kinase [Wujia sp.]
MDTGQIEIRDSRRLPTDTVLHDKYIVKGVLGEGGFGITYEGIVCGDSTKVAIKEYFPHEIAIRCVTDSGLKLHVFSEEFEEQYEHGRKRFLQEAQTLRMFQYLYGIVCVIDCFEEHNTAYIVMEYIEGITLKQYINDNGVLTFSEIMELFAPVMKSLIQIHRQGLVHRDISPENIIIGLDNQARLIDFGAAGWIENTSDRTRTVIVKNGYAPPEQYIQSGKQGPWMDVYGLAATMYMALVGHAPQPAVERMQEDRISISDFEGCDMQQWQKEGLLAAMELNLAKRYRNVEDFYHALCNSPDTENTKTVIADKVSGKRARRIKRLGKRSFPFVRILMAVGAVLFIVGLGLALADKSHDKKAVTTQENELSTLTDTQPKGNPEPSIITMPSVVNETEASARSKIKNVDAKIVIRVEYRYDKEVEKGLVITQSVAANTVYNSGAISQITLMVSKGAQNMDEKTDNKSPSDIDTQPENRKATTQESPVKEATTQEAATQQTTTQEMTTQEPFDIREFDDTSEFETIGIE